MWRDSGVECIINFMWQQAKCIVNLGYFIASTIGN